MRCRALRRDFWWRFSAGPAAAQWVPVKPMRMVVPFAAGGTIDIIGRLLSQPLSRASGRTIVDDRPGGGTVIGVDIGARAGRRTHAAADGTELCINPFARSAAAIPRRISPASRGSQRSAAVFSASVVARQDTTGTDCTRARETRRTDLWHREPDRLSAPCR